MELKIPEMSCGHCKATIEKTILALDPGAALTFNMERRVLSVHTTAALEVLQGALHQAGYPTEHLPG